MVRMLIGADKHVAYNATWANLRTKISELPTEGLKELASGRTSAPTDLPDDDNARVDWVIQWVKENSR